MPAAAPSVTPPCDYYAPKPQEFSLWRRPRSTQARPPAQSCAARHPRVNGRSPGAYELHLQGDARRIGDMGTFVRGPSCPSCLSELSVPYVPTLRVAVSLPLPPPCVQR